MKIHVVIPENSPLSSTYEGPAPTQEQEMVELRKLTVAMGKEAIIAQYLDGVGHMVLQLLVGIH